jgi:Protein of unknown function (DUF3616)
MKAASSFMLALVFTCVQPAFADTWQLEATTQKWTVTGEIDEDESVSGAATYGAQQGLLVTDEVRAVQPFQINLKDQTLQVSAPITLLPGDGKELDLEAIVASTEGQCYYTIGSHSVSRKNGKVQPDRLHVFCLPVDAKTSQIKADAIRMTSLVPIIQADELLKSSLGKPSEKDGFDIEGLTESQGQLFFGLRSPNLDGQAFILEVKAEDLFADPKKTAHRTHPIKLGPGLGIRDLIKTSTGFLFIAGPSDGGDSELGYTLHSWAGPESAASLIGTISTPEDAKAEGLLLLEESATTLKLLVLFDGAKNGAPTCLTLTRRPAGN